MGIERDDSTFTADELEAQTAMVRNADEWVGANDGLRFTLPTLMIDDLYSVQAGAASFNIHPMRAHTRGDLVIHFPQLKLVATGDLADAMPYTGHGYPSESLGASTYLTGHGAAQTNDGLIDKLLIYFDSLTSQVRLLPAEGNTADQIRADIDFFHSHLLLASDDDVAARCF